MSFQHFPELEWRHGFQWSLALMLVSMLGMVGFFRWRHWLQATRFAENLICILNPTAH